MNSLIRFSEVHAAIVRAAARRAGLPVSLWIKTQAIEAARKTMPTTKPLKPVHMVESKPVESKPVEKDAGFVMTQEMWDARHKK